jgi:hypothetical protein
MLQREHEARGELVITYNVMRKEYWRLQAASVLFGESKEEKQEWSGAILGALRSLFLYEQGYWYEDPDLKGKDTYHWCLALHDCTKYLACDDRYKDKSWPSKDDRFKGVYQNNSGFRRRWVAFLRQIMEYVELINQLATAKPYASRDALQAAYREACRDGGESVHAQRAAQHRDLTGYNWDRMKQEIETAQQKIDAEVSTWQKIKKWVPGLGAELEDGDDVGAMIARLRELSV